MKLNAKLIIIMLLVAVLPLTALSFIYYYTTKSTLTDQFLHFLKSTSEIQEHRVNAYIQDSQERLLLFTSRTLLKKEIQNYLETEDEVYLNSINELLIDNKRRNANIRELHILNMDGVIVASTDDSRIGEKHAESDFFIKGKNDVSVDTFFKVNNEVKPGERLRAYLSGPLVLDEKQIGVMAIESPTNDLFEIFEDQTGLGTTGEWELGMTSSDGSPVVLVPGRFELDKEAPLKKTIRNEYTSAPLVRAIKGEEVLLKDVADESGTKYMMSTNHVESLSWGLSIRISEKEAYKSLEAFRNIIVLVSGVLTFLIFLLSYAMARYISSPIAKIVKATQQIKKGDFSSRIDVNTKDELGEMSVAFNDMTEKLGDFYKNSEMKVKESTMLFNKAQHIAHLGSFSYDFATNTVQLSEELLTIFGIPPGTENVTYKTLLAYLDDEERAHLTNLWNSARKDGSSATYEFNIVRTDGSNAELLLEAEVERASDNTPLKIFGSVQDITKTKKERVELQERTRELYEMNKLMVGREMKMIELKQELEKIKKGES